MARATAQGLLEAADAGALAAVAARYRAALSAVLPTHGHSQEATTAVAAAHTARDRLSQTPLTSADVQAAVSELLVCSSALTTTHIGPTPAEPCDFCGRDPRRALPRWIYPVHPTASLAGFPGLGGTDLEAGWRACQDCAELVEADDYAELGKLMGSPDGALPRALRSFRDNRAGDAVAIAPAGR